MSSSYEIDRKRWANMTIFEQMGNIYSEVGRSFSAKRRLDIVGQDSATVRAIDLFDATVAALIAQKSIRAKEVLRAKDQFLQTLYDESVSESDMGSLDRYFLQFALVARRDH